MASRPTKEELYLFNKLQEKRKIQVLNMKDHSMSGLVRGASDIYPDPAHFVYELLQNADDAKASKAAFYLYNDHLVFKHNGKRQFTITEDGELGEEVKPSPYGDINSITAYSSSKDNEPNTIGKFGLGFKSVYNYTDRPEIYDDKFHFAIERRMVPILLGHDHMLRQSGETLFVLPFKASDISVNEISERLKSLEAPTLFLNHLDTINYYDQISGNSYHFSKVTNVKRTSGDITYELIQIDDPGETSQLILFHRKKKIASKILEVSVGYFFNQLGEIDTSTTRGIHCFFPTKESFGLCFISHAPFLLTNNRQNINDEDINNELITAICHLAADALVILRDYKKNKKQLISDNLYSILPYKYYIEQSRKYDFQRDYSELTSRIHFLNAVKELLKTEALLYTNDKHYVTSQKGCILSPSTLDEVVRIEHVRELLGNEDLELLKIKEDSDLRLFLTDFFEIQSFSPEDLAQDLTPEFMEQQGVDWAIRLYKYLKEKGRKLSVDKSSRKQDLPFRYAPIFKSQNNTWIPAFKIVDGKEQPNIYLPIGKTRGSYNFIHPSIVEKSDDSLNGFYNDMGIKKPDVIDYIQKHLIPKYQEDEIDVEQEELISDINSVIRILKNEDSEYNRNKIIRLVKENFYFRSTNELYYKPEDLYIESDELGLYFEDNEDVAFIDLDYYSEDDEQTARKELIDFFVDLGVASKPRIIQSPRKSPFSVNQERVTKIDFEYSTQGYDIKDYNLDGFLHFVKENLCEETSIYLWRILCDYKIDAFRNGFYDYFYYSPKSKTFETSLLDNLKHSKWLINSEGAACLPREITQREMMSCGYEKNDKLFELLGIRTEEKSILELGGSVDQQRQQYLGAQMEKHGFSLSDVYEFLEWKRKQEEPEPEKEPTVQTNHSVLGPTNSTRHTTSQTNTYGDLPSSEGSSDLDDLFGSGDTQLPTTNSSKGNSSRQTVSKDIEELNRKLDEDKKNKLEREMLKQEVASLEKYSKEWFKAKLELEYRESSDTDTPSTIKRSVSIAFSRIVLDWENKRLYELRNPSRDIPLWVEEIENITINFLFNSREELSYTFEVANVRDYSLRLKAKAADAEALASIDWRTFTKATLDINNPTNLVNNFRRAFNELPLPDGYNLKTNLRKSISFVFGPPGTGKTTYLAKEIVKQMNQSPRNVNRILVLAPTNKACDVLVRKIMEITDQYAWLGRFVTTGDNEIEEIGVVCDRDSVLYSQNKCCIVTTMARLPYDGFNDETGFHALREIDWNYVICDEASMLPIAQITYAIYKFKNTPMLIAGDPMQIAPIDVTNNWDSENIYDMVNLKSFENPKTEPIQFTIHNLETQYRSIPAIGGLFSDYAYNGRLKHYWKQKDQLPLNISELPLKSINYIPFRVESYDSMFGAKKLANSPIHIYSALLASQLCRYIAKKYVENNPDEEEFVMGVVCPYASQAQLILRMLEQVTDIPDGIEITVGTVHSFQGDQCNIIFAMLNPPTGLRHASAAAKMHINNKNIINVAISRAKDYLCLLVPDKGSCAGFENLTEIKALGELSKTKYRNETSLFSANQIERVVFGKQHYLENNTFVTSHQLANVYTKATCLYEVRIDENSVDIQIGE